MSIYYYFACDDCKKKTTVIAVERLLGRHLDHQGELLSFLMIHTGHKLNFFSEFDDDRYEYAWEKYPDGQENEV